MPRYSDEMRYVPATKTHWTFACKLGKDRTHTLFNKPNGPKIVFQKNDTEGADISTAGVSAVIYEASIWEDMEAVHAIANVGNLNSKIDEVEDEMQAFGRVDALYNDMAKEKE